MESPENDGVGVGSFESVEQVILRWDSSASEDARVRMIFDGDHHEIDQYLQAIDEIHRSMESTNISAGEGSSSPPSDAIFTSCRRKLRP